MEKLQKCVNFILTVPVFFATSCIFEFHRTLGVRSFIHLMLLDLTVIIPIEGANSKTFVTFFLNFNKTSGIL
jgi:hypothetical protein